MKYFEEKLSKPLTIPYKDINDNENEIVVQGFYDFQGIDRSVGIPNAYVCTAPANTEDNQDHTIVIFDSGEIQYDDEFIGMCDPVIIFGKEQ